MAKRKGDSATPCEKIKIYSLNNFTKNVNNTYTKNNERKNKNDSYAKRKLPSYRP